MRKIGLFLLMVLFAVIPAITGCTSNGPGDPFAEDSFEEDEGEDGGLLGDNITVQLLANDWHDGGGSNKWAHWPIKRVISDFDPNRTYVVTIKGHTPENMGTFHTTIYMLNTKGKGTYGLPTRSVKANTDFEYTWNLQPLASIAGFKTSAVVHFAMFTNEPMTKSHGKVEFELTDVTITATAK